MDKSAIEFGLIPHLIAIGLALLILLYVLMFTKKKYKIALQALETSRNTALKQVKHQESIAVKLAEHLARVKGELTYYKTKALEAGADVYQRG